MSDFEENSTNQDEQVPKQSKSNIVSRTAQNYLRRRAMRKASQVGNQVVRQAAFAAARAVGTLVVEAIIAFLPWILLILAIVAFIVIIMYKLSGGNLGGTPAGCTASASATANSPATGDTLTQAQASQLVAGAGISISSSGGCSDKNNKSCTSLDGVRQNTINGILSFKKLSSTNVVITGGTETGHAAGTYSHGNGYKLDIKDSADVSNYIVQKFKYLGERTGDHGGPSYQDPAGNIYVLERGLNHFDITFTGNNPAPDGTSNTASTSAACDTTPGPTLPASTDDCNGFYKPKMDANRLLKTNFGDPKCELLIPNGKGQTFINKGAIYTLLKSLYPGNTTVADGWFNKVIPCESGYNADSWNPNSPDPHGAWGLTQMGSSLPDPGGSGPGRNGPLDRNDVYWQTQLSNAAGYLQKIGLQNGGKYWWCWR